MVFALSAANRSAVFLALVVSLLPSRASADVVYTLGQIDHVADPDPMFSPVDRTQIFFEGSARGDPLVFSVNATERRRYFDEPASDCGLTVSELYAESHFAFQNPGTYPLENDAIVVFSGPIIGVSYESACTALSDPLFRRPGISYGSGGLGLTPREGDVLEIFPSGRTLSQRLSALGEGDWDGYRIVTRAPADDLITDVRLDCTGLGGAVDAGEDREVDLRLHNDGALEAPDAQIVFRLPLGSTLASFEGPFDCEPHLSAALYICASNAGPILPGERADLRLVLHFDEAPALVERLVAFGSGAVRDPALENNECDLRVFGPDVPDGALPDGALPDGAIADGATGDAARVDASTSVDVPASFRGAGGCACGVATRGRRRGAVTVSLLLVFALAVRRRSRRRWP